MSKIVINILLTKRKVRIIISKKGEIKMRKIKKCKGGEKVKTLTRNKVKHEDGTLTKEQLDQLMPILEEIKRRRELGIQKYYTLEETMEILNKALEEE